MATFSQNKYTQQYNQSRILTASPAELTLMLYDGAIKFCNIALLGFEQSDWSKVHINIVKVENIIMEFQATLNRKYAVADDFDKLYKYIYGLLVDANVYKDKELLERALVEIRGMRDTWKEVMRLTNNGTNVGNAAGNYDPLGQRQE